MATLNETEQAKVDRYQELLRGQRNGDRYVTSEQVENARELADRAEANAEARERFQQQRTAEKDAEAQKHQARWDAEVLAAQSAYQRQARATFPGTPAQFDAAWPELLKNWQIRNTADGFDALVERKKASGMYG